MPNGVDDPFNKRRVWFQLESSFKEASRQLDNRLKSAGMSRISFATLEFLAAQRHAIPAMQLCRPTGGVPSSISALLQRMEREGLCLRHQDPIDGRGVLVSITPLGKERLKQAEWIYIKWLDQQFGGGRQASLETLRQAAVVLSDCLIKPD
jgi:DNA-binding MarR family transcriptional regulator